jgi:hypothetical protein
MIDGTINEFINMLYYGEEIVFTYKNRKYFIQGWYNKKEEKATMVLDDVTELTEHDYIWKYSANTMRECADVFLASPLWDGKDFLQIQENVTWSDW